MYKNKNPYQISEIFKMHERCANCQTKYKIEPSFFYGSMYVSYGVGIAFALVAFVVSYLIFKWSLVSTFIVIVLTLIAFMPLIMRWSRNIWINLFMHYDKGLRE